MGKEAQPPLQAVPGFERRFTPIGLSGRRRLCRRSELLPLPFARRGDDARGGESQLSESLFSSGGLVRRCGRSGGSGRRSWPVAPRQQLVRRTNTEETASFPELNSATYLLHPAAATGEMDERSYPSLTPRCSDCAGRL